jgi:hypothetical protein
MPDPAEVAESFDVAAFDFIPASKIVVSAHKRGEKQIACEELARGDLMQAPSRECASHTASMRMTSLRAPL